MENSLADPTDKYQKQAIILGEFVSAVGQIANEFDNRNVIIRPHPSEDTSLYQKLFTPYENVIIRKEGEVRPWILASDAIIHNSCTTGVASALLGTPTFAYMPNDLQVSSTPNDVSIKCNSVSELARQLNEYVDTTTKYNMNENQIANIRPFIDNINYISSMRIADIIESMDHEKANSYSQYFNPSFKSRLKSSLIKAAGSRTFEKMYYEKLKGGRSTSYKFSETTVEEVASLVNALPEEIVPEALNIKQIPGVMYGFQLAKEENEVY
jgi:hypothetical protein